MNTKTQVFHRAIHRRVLVVYVANTPIEKPADKWPGDWAAYVVPVPGQNHKEEAAAWRRDGSKLKEKEARALWPAVAADFDAAGIKWRP
jgi:hypothetical protein